jgi:hypothetical protein
MSRSTICWTDIPVIDMKRAVAFYSELLGREVPLHDYDDWKYGLLPHAEARPSVCLAPADEEHQPGRNGPLVYLAVDGRLDAAIKVAADKGGKVLENKRQIGPYGFRAIIVDSEGNRIALHSETA